MANYNGASLVPQIDINQLLRVSMGIAQERNEKARGAEVADLTGQLATAKNPLEDPETLKVISRLNTLDPQAAQFGISLLQAQDEKQLRDTKQEATNASRFYQAVLDTKDPVERNRFIAQTIRERQEAGQDTGKLTELMGLDPNKQSLMARRQLILSGDAGLLADTGMKALKEQLDVTNANLERLQRERDLAAGKETDVAGLRKEFTGQSKQFIDIRDANERIKAVAKQDSAAGDLALIFNYMKVLDPTSAVRETEQASAQNAAGVPQQVRNLWNRALTGERLSPDQRKDFVSTAGSIAKSSEASHDRLRGEYERIAKKRGFDPTDVVVDFSAPEDAAPAVEEVAPGVKQVGKFTVRVK